MSRQNLRCPDKMKVNNKIVWTLSSHVKIVISRPDMKVLSGHFFVFTQHSTYSNLQLNPFQVVLEEMFHLAAHQRNFDF